MMKLITRELLAKTAASDFIEHYPLPKYEEVYNNLIALGAYPDPDEVDEILKPYSEEGWTSTFCENCGRENIPVVGFQIFIFQTVGLCKHCLKEAVDLISK